MTFTNPATVVPASPSDAPALHAFRSALQALPLVAILRGLTPAEAPAIGDALREAGFRLIEVPLNSPEPFESIGVLARRLPDCVVGAGTVLDAAQVQAVRDSGGALVVAPNLDREVVSTAVALGIPAIPGVATPSEAFAALKAGAAAIKLFPAEGIPPEVVRAWRAVIPADVPLLPVGGIVAQAMAAYRNAGASGFGLGSALYRPGDRPEAVADRARRFVSAWNAALGRFTA